MKTILKNALKEAMKTKDKVQLDTLRALLTAIQYEEIRKKSEDLPPEDINAIIKNEIKKRRETIDFAEKGGRSEALPQLKQEIEILERYLPKQLSAEELETILLEMKNSNPTLNMGAAMKQLKEKHAGLYDGKLASELAKRLLG
ncbi:MAG: GatB/YqeY domain-containing protein [Deltaproteobacteria bacterium]|nr:GatB/YqeY domain-containing protein [Deltaproteobacteria bacterium]